MTAGEDNGDVATTAGILSGDLSETSTEVASASGNPVNGEPTGVDSATMSSATPLAAALLCRVPRCDRWPRGEDCLCEAARGTASLRVEAALLEGEPAARGATARSGGVGGDRGLLRFCGGILLRGFGRARGGHHKKQDRRMPKRKDGVGTAKEKGAKDRYHRQRLPNRSIRDALRVTGRKRERARGTHTHLCRSRRLFFCCCHEECEARRHPAGGKACCRQRSVAAVGGAAFFQVSCTWIAGARARWCLRSFLRAALHTELLAETTFAYFSR